MKTRNKPDKIDHPSKRSNIVTSTPQHIGPYKCKNDFQIPAITRIACAGT